MFPPFRLENRLFFTFCRVKKPKKCNMGENVMVSCSYTKCSFLDVTTSGGGKLIVLLRIRDIFVFISPESGMIRLDFSFLVVT